jgi:hypothetical protein
MAAKNDAMAMEVSSLVVQMKGQKHPRSTVESSQCVQHKKSCIKGDANVLADAAGAVAPAAAEAKAAAEAPVKDYGEEQEKAPTCSRRSCYIATTWTKSGRWRKQCDSCKTGTRVKRT